MAVGAVDAEDEFRTGADGGLDFGGVETVDGDAVAFGFEGAFWVAGASDSAPPAGERLAVAACFFADSGISSSASAAASSEATGRSRVTAFGS